MTEKDVFLATHLRECQTTQRLIAAFPADHADFKPHERSRSAAELAFALGNHELFFCEAATGSMNLSFFGNPAPAAIAEALQTLEKNAILVDATVRNIPDADLNSIIHFAGRDMRRFDVMWANLYDLIHHRGQFSVYVRMAGGKVPSIYGPSADDPGRAAAA
jgi:uncharacterized damage-inducible protein DinB